MQRGQHAALGATTLTTTWSTCSPSPTDVRRSIELVGTTSASVSRPGDPISAARRWLADPARSSELDPATRVRAERAIDVAEAHLRELDALALEISAQVDGGDVDPSRLTHMDSMAGELIAFSDRLRVLLDPTERVDDAAERLDRGLEAASSGGLRALVAAI